MDDVIVVSVSWRSWKRDQSFSKKFSHLESERVAVHEAYNGSECCNATF